MNHSDFENMFPIAENVFPNLFPDAQRQEPGNLSSAISKNLRRDLRERLLALPYRTFLRVVAQLLESLGGQNVHLLGRDGFVGRNRGGGWDLEATLPPSEPFGSSQPGVQCIIQVKQFSDLAVQQRSIDELRGCCLRAGAGQGLIVTTSHFSPVAHRAAAASVLAPITLIDGETLVELLAWHGMGVIQAKSGKQQLDPEFFQSLSASADALPSGAAQQSSSGSHQARTDKRTDINSIKPRISAVVKKHRSQQTVLHFSVTLGTRKSNNGERAEVK